MSAIKNNTPGQTGNSDGNTRHDPVADAPKPSESENAFHSQAMSRILYSVLIGLFGWIAMWLFAVVTVVQWGFLLFTGQVNQNLKGFASEVVQYLVQVLRYLAFASDEKPFPFSPWTDSSATPAATGTGQDGQA